MRRHRFIPAAVGLLLSSILLGGCAPRPVPSGDAAEDLPPATDRRWPSFRGDHATGIAQGQVLPTAWDVESGENIRWRIRIPGLAHSSPVIWDGRVFVTTAVSSREDASFKHGLYGAGDAHRDRSAHRWLVLAIDLADGRVVWEREAHRGVPEDKRHIKATYANSSPATDGRRVIAAFGSEGVHAYSFDGEPLWSVDLGRLDAGAYDAPDYEWGSASSPILWRDRVFVQCDTQGDDFLVALDADSGRELWRVARDELPSWSTPTVVEPPGGRPELVTNAPNAIRANDPFTGTELWRLTRSSKITAPTPVFGDGLIVVASGRRPEKPILAIRPGGSGDITPPADETQGPFLAWSSRGRGPYMPTPLLYDGVLYVLNNNGVFDAYDAQTGKELFRERVEHGGGGFSASPVAADGSIYLASEDGDVFVIHAGRRYSPAGSQSIGERMMATPAIGDGVILFRGEHHLVAVARR